MPTGDNKEEWCLKVLGGALTYLIASNINILKAYCKLTRNIKEYDAKFVRNVLMEIKKSLKILSINGYCILLINRLYNELRSKQTPDTSLIEKTISTLEELDTIIRKELSSKPIVIFNPKGRLDYARLIKSGLIGLLQDSDLLDKLSNIVSHDLEEALYCLCFERPTAATMVALRAVEAALRQLYLTLKPDAEIEHINWGRILSELEELFRQYNIEARTLLGYLDHLREIRNRAEHPDKIFNQVEAEDALIHACYATKEIYNIIKQHGRRG